MSWCGDIRIKFYKSGAFSEMLSILHQAGWGFYNDIVCYDSYTDIVDYGINSQYASVSELPSILSLLDTKSEAGERVSMDFYWQGDGAHITCELTSPESLWITWDASQPLLSGSSCLTDFSWLLSRIAIPLMEAGYDPQSIACCDEH